MKEYKDCTPDEKAFAWFLGLLIIAGSLVVLGGLYIFIRDTIYPKYRYQIEADVQAELFDKKMQSIKKNIPNMENDAMALMFLDKMSRAEKECNRK
jgi:hypothetical protein